MGKTTIGRKWNREAYGRQAVDRETGTGRHVEDRQWDREAVGYGGKCQTGSGKADWYGEAGVRQTIGQGDCRHEENRQWDRGIVGMWKTDSGTEGL